TLQSRGEPVPRLVGAAAGTRCPMASDLGHGCARGRPLRLLAARSPHGNAPQVPVLPVLMAPWGRYLLMFFVTGLVVIGVYAAAFVYQLGAPVEAEYW